MSNTPRIVTIKGSFHALIGIFGCTLFVCWWHRVLPQIDSREAMIALIFISVTVLASVCVALLRVRDNIAIFRRKGPRKPSTRVEENRFTDFLGRRIEISEQGFLKTARLIVGSLNVRD